MRVVCLVLLFSLTVVPEVVFAGKRILRSPGDVSQSLWKSLNISVGGRLFKSEAFAQRCFSNTSSLSVHNFDSPACLKIQAEYQNETVISDAIGGYINTQWGTCQALGEQCLLDYTNSSNIKAALPPYTCQLGSVPQYFINVSSPEDISAAFLFSLKTGVELIVKNTGHDYKGRSSAPNSLALWTHHLKNMTISNNFVADGCSGPAHKTVTLGAGVQFREIYALAEANNFTFVGGSDFGVGATGGWLLGGGHSGLSNTLGLGADRVVQFKVVTPDGQFRTANACQNQDLFFALRGGGGGTFGVVYEATSIVSPPVTLQVAAVISPIQNLTFTEGLWSILIENGLRWAQEGWGSFSTSESALFVTPTLNASAANVSMQPLLQYGDSLQKSGVQGVQVLFTEFPSWGTFFDAFAGTDSAAIGASLALASRLVQKDLFASETNRTALRKALLTAHQMTSGTLRFLGSAPFNFPGDGGTSVTDAWRDTVYHVTLIAPWNYNATIQEKRAQYTLVSDAIDNVRKLTPSAAYSNEADIHEPDYEVAFWGTHYNRLLSIKRKYDPHELLNCWQCVGWNRSSKQFECYL